MLFTIFFFIVVVCVKVGVVADALTLTGSIHDYPVVPECDLNVNLSRLLDSGNLSDVTLAIGNKEFKAHKAILAGKGSLNCACTNWYCSNH